MMSVEIQKLLLDKHMSKAECAERCGWSPANFYNKLHRDNFSEKELRTIAEALGCKLEIKFVLGDE